MGEPLTAFTSMDLSVEKERLNDALVGLETGKLAVRSIVLGQEDVIDQVIIALLAGGHVLIESPPGLGKTLLVRTIGTVFGLKFHRIQFTPDLMPADITGTQVLVGSDRGEGLRMTFQPGPVFAEMVLADEINRATPKTQSALLEAMQEGTTTVMGVEYELPKPFFVLATQNPIEMEGTYVLPEAQVDRFFFKVALSYPSEPMLESILDATTGVEVPLPETVLSPADVVSLQKWTREVPIASELRRMAARIVLLTQPDSMGSPESVRRFVRYGVSPRGGQALVLAAKARALMAGRFNVAIDDIRSVSVPALRHRMQVNYEGAADGVDVDELVSEVVEAAIKQRR